MLFWRRGWKPLLARPAQALRPLYFPKCWRPVGMPVCVGVHRWWCHSWPYVFYAEVERAVVAKEKWHITFIICRVLRKTGLLIHSVTEAEIQNTFAVLSVVGMKQKGGVFIYMYFFFSFSPNWCFLSFQLTLILSFRRLRMSSF